jgi:lipoprotein-anchoring transpeptidase ErfK/SrfK
VRNAFVVAAFVASLSHSGSAGAGQSGGASDRTGTALPPAGKALASARIERADEPILAAPEQGGQRRGSAAKGARLPVYAEHPGPGCATRWLNVGPLAWICGDHAPVSETPPDARGWADVRYPDGLPYRYFFVGPNGSLAYASLATAEDVAPTRELEPEFALAIVNTAEKAPGEPFGLTASGLWVPMRDLSPARQVTFAGRALAGSCAVAGCAGLTDQSGASDVGWVIADAARVYRRPGVAAREAPRVSRFTELTILERARHGKASYVRVGDESWLDAREVTVRRPATPPAEARPGERWIDVDRTTQILTAYAGTTAAFSTLMSTGKGQEGTAQATPAGTFRLWVKLLSTDMDNLEDEEAGRFYAIQRVPWVMFFKEGYGLHGTFWHQRFGQVRSHGCVNLAPRDAERLFSWTTPHLPVGWTAVLPTEYEPGTLVVVR